MLRELPVQQLLRDTHLGKLPVEGPPRLQEIEPAQKLHLVADRSAGPSEQLLRLRLSFPGLAGQPFQVLPRRAEIAFGAVARPDPAGESLQALAEHFRGGRFDAGRGGGARRLGHGRRDAVRFLAGRLGGG